VISNPVVGLNIDSGGVFHLEVFVVGTNHALYYNREGTLGAWSGFIRLPSYIIGDPVVSSFSGVQGGTDKTTIVVVGGDNALYLNRQAQSGAWSGFARLGGIAISNPALSVNADRRFQIFVVASDHALYTSAETAPGSGAFSGFAKLGGYVIGNPAVVFQDNGLLDVFVVGSDHVVYVNREATSAGIGTWNGFEKLGGPSVISDPIVTADNFGQFVDGSRQINMFVIGSNHAVYHLAQVAANSDTWTFEFLGGSVIGDPATGRFFATSTVETIVFELFVVGSDQALYYNQNPTFCGPQPGPGC
jgi:hypothetical protein